jgi:hypothetical protein
MTGRTYILEIHGDYGLEQSFRTFVDQSNQCRMFGISMLTTFSTPIVAGDS